MPSTRHTAHTFMHRAAIGMLGAALAIGVAAPASATTLTFEVFSSDPFFLNGNFDNPAIQPVESGYGYLEGFRIPGNYGDNVTGTGPVLSVVDPLDPLQLFRYDIGAEGDTPDVTVSYGPYSIFTGGPSLWREGYGDLNGVLYQGSWYADPNNPVGTDYNVLDIVLVAAAGWDVVLEGFDVAATTAQTINSVSIFSGVPFPFLTPTNFIGTPLTNVSLPGGGHTSFSASDFGVGSLTSQIIWLRIDHGNVPDDIGGGIIGLDNVKFRQVANLSNGAPTVDPEAEFLRRADAEVPEPATLMLLLAGGGLAVHRARRRHRSA